MRRTAAPGPFGYQEWLCAAGADVNGNSEAPPQGEDRGVVAGSCGDAFCIRPVIAPKLRLNKTKMRQGRSRANAMLRSLLASMILLCAASAAAQNAGGDAAAGQRVFNQCRACHTVDAGGRAGVGPNLHGVIGRRAAAIDGFRYSPSMRQRAEGGLTWTEDNLRAYLRNPKEIVPAGTMSFPGLRNDQQLNDLMAYLRQQQG